jgi:hypothetical protein
VQYALNVPFPNEKIGLYLESRSSNAISGIFLAFIELENLELIGIFDYLIGSLVIQTYKKIRLL